MTATAPAQPCLPFSEAERVDPAGALALRNLRVAQVLRATCSRRDVLRRRAQIALLLLRWRCPLKGRPRKSWYVNGAVARVGAQGLIDRWAAYYDEPAPSLRSLRAHLGELEAAGVLVRSPGDWIPILRDPEHPERRPRYPDTFHVLECDDAVEWWRKVGRARLLENRAARHNPDAWERLFGGWRAEAAELAQGGLLPFEEPEPEAEVADGLGRGVEESSGIETVSPAVGVRKDAGGAPTRGVGSKGETPVTAERRRAAHELAAAVRRRANPFELLHALVDAGAHLVGGPAHQVLRKPARLEGAVALLAFALHRGDRIRSKAGWVYHAFRYAPPGELALAVGRLRGEVRP